MNNDKQMVMRLLQDKKDFSIAFYNATNSALAIITKGDLVDEDQVKKDIVMWRDFFLVEHAKYRQDVIEPMNDEVTKQSIISGVSESLKAITSIPNLTKLWIQLSEDERHNNDIIEMFKTKKKEYEKA